MLVRDFDRASASGAPKETVSKLVEFGTMVVIMSKLSPRPESTPPQ